MTVGKSVRIPGMTGVLHPLWMERIKGILDGKSQVRQVEKGYSTPYIERTYSCFHSAMNKGYRQAVDDLEPTFQETAHNLQELISLRRQEGSADGQLLGEEGMRAAAAQVAHHQACRQREQELVVRLKELKAIFETANERMEHWCCQMNAAVRMRLSCYWGGILKSSGDKALPPFPMTEEVEIPGRQSFRQRVGEALNQIVEGASVIEREEDCNA